MGSKDMKEILKIINMKGEVFYIMETGKIL